MSTLALKDDGVSHHIGSIDYELQMCDVVMMFILSP